MKAESLEEVYHRMCGRRDAIYQHYLKNTLLKINDPVSYRKYQQEFRDINKRLRIIRQCIPANPTLKTDPDKG